MQQIKLLEFLFFKEKCMLCPYHLSSIKMNYILQKDTLKIYGVLLFSKTFC